VSDMVALADLVSESRSGYWGAGAGEQEMDVRIVRNGDMAPDGSIRWRSLPVRSLTAPEVERAALRRDDLLLTTSGNCGTVAHIVAPPHETTCASNFVRILRVEAERVLPRYLYHFMRFPQFQASIAPYIRGTTLKNLSLSAALPAVQCPLPSLGEQRRIAGILDRVESIRAARLRSIILLEDLIHAAFLEMFADASIPVVPLAEVISETKLGLVRGSSELNLEPGTAYVRMNAITDKGALTADGLRYTNVSEAEATGYALRPGDLLFNTRNSRELVGKTALVPPHLEGAVFNNNLMRIRFKALIEPEYVAFAFRTPVAQKYLESCKVGTTSVFAIYAKTLMAMPVPLPPVDEQRLFAAYVGAARMQQDRLASTQDHLDELRRTVGQRAFRGEL
jgi:type I restriction enzyme S subunit